MGEEKPENERPEGPLAASKEVSRASTGLLRSSGVVSFFTMLSRIMGLIRDVVLARVILSLIHI